jgi:hypothetical protein
MLVFLVLGMTAGFTVFWRRFMLVAAAIYYFESGELLAPFLFFSGAILAEIALIQNRQTSIPATTQLKDETRNLWKVVVSYWPLALAFVALILASVPPENPHYVPYSRFLWYWFDGHLTARGGTLVIDTAVLIVKGRLNEQSARLGV